MQGYIYRWRNVTNDWSYIGSTVQVRKRRNLHLFLLRSNRHHSHHLQAAWNKYGEASFVFELLAVVDCDNQVELRDVESDYLKRDAGELYNAAPEARSVLNIERSDETRAKIRAALIGRKRSPETRARIPEAQRKRAASTRNLAPLLASRRGVTLTPEHRAKIGEANRRRVLSDESRMRMRLAQLRARAVDPTRWARAGRVRGFRHSPETKQRISDALRGKPKSTAAVLKQAAALSGRPNGALLLSPDGILHRVLNASAFARQHGLNQQSVSAVILGKRRVHKGWTLASADEVTAGR